MINPHREDCLGLLTGETCEDRDARRSREAYDALVTILQQRRQHGLDIERMDGESLYAG